MRPPSPCRWLLLIVVLAAAHCGVGCCVSRGSCGTTRTLARRRGRKGCVLAVAVAGEGRCVFMFARVRVCAYVFARAVLEENKGVCLISRSLLWLWVTTPSPLPLSLLFLCHTLHPTPSLTQVNPDGDEMGESVSKERQRSEGGRGKCKCVRVAEGTDTDRHGQTGTDTATPTHTHASPSS